MSESVPLDRSHSRTLARADGRRQQNPRIRFAPPQISPTDDSRLRDAFLWMVGDLPCRPRPRHLFDNVAAADASTRGPTPWARVCVAIAAAALAGAKRDRVLRFIHELEAYALGFFIDGSTPNLTAELIAQADAAAAAQPLEARALAHADRATIEQLIICLQSEQDHLDSVLVAARRRLSELGVCA